MLIYKLKNQINSWIYRNTLPFPLIQEVSDKCLCVNVPNSTTYMYVCEQPLACANLCAKKNVVISLSGTTDCLQSYRIVHFFSSLVTKWASSRENRSLGFPTRCDSNRPAQPQKLARGLKFPIYKLEVLYYLGSENKGADQTVPMHRLICSFVVHIWLKQVFSWRGSNMWHWQQGLNVSKTFRQIAVYAKTSYSYLLVKNNGHSPVTCI